MHRWMNQSGMDGDMAFIGCRGNTGGGNITRFKGEVEWDTDTEDKVRQS